MLKGTLKDISNRNDISVLVTTFYSKIRKDEELGPIFNKQIHDWDSHLSRLTDFWETNLMAVRSFKGNPLLKHKIVDAKNNYTIENYHFGIWLRYWITTINELFSGEKAEIAKNRARKMGTFMYFKLFENKPKNRKD